MTDQKEMPKYKCHKEVWAFKIEKIERDVDLAKKENRETDGTIRVTPADKGYAPFKLSHDFVQKHSPVEGGYFVQYEDGYMSYSPAKTFESGYTLIN